MNRPPHTQNLPEPSVIPQEGWHCSHFYYSFDRVALQGFSDDELTIAKEQFCHVLALNEDGPERLQVSIVSGHKADFGLMIMDPNPLTIDRTHQNLLNTKLGATLTTTYSFVSVTEISEYVPTLEQYAARLVEDGEEIDKYNTNPNLPDTDRDGLSDGEELKLHKTNFVISKLTILVTLIIVITTIILVMLR